MRAKVAKSHESLLLTIGDRLKQLRIDRGYSSHENFANDYELPRVQYWRMEKGIANITFKSLAKVLAVHKLTVDEFLLSVLKKRRTK